MFDQNETTIQGILNNVKCNCVTKTPSYKAHAKNCAYRLHAENQILRSALKFYAEQNHMLGEFDDFDSVSGEPLNCLWHESEPYGVETGTIASNALNAVK